MVHAGASNKILILFTHIFIFFGSRCNSIRMQEGKESENSSAQSKHIILQMKFMLHHSTCCHAREIYSSRVWSCVCQLIGSVLLNETRRKRVYDAIRSHSNFLDLVVDTSPIGRVWSTSDRDNFLRKPCRKWNQLIWWPRLSIDRHGRLILMTTELTNSHLISSPNPLERSNFKCLRIDQ